MIFQPFPLAQAVGGGIIPPPPIPAPPPVYDTPAPAPAAGVVVVIPTEHGTEQVPPYQQSQVLSQVTYGLALRWNARANVWTATATAANGSLLADSIPIRNGIPVAAWAATVPGFPVGTFFAIPVDHNPADASQSDLGARVLLTYLDPTATA